MDQDNIYYDVRIREQALRMGFDEGEEFTCTGIIPAGPVVLSKHRQEIAVGRELARQNNVQMMLPVRHKPRRVLPLWKTGYIRGAC